MTGAPTSFGPAPAGPSGSAATSPSPARPSSLSPRVAAAPRPRPSGWRTWAPVRIWKRHFPPVRLVWLFLLVLVWNGKGFLTTSVAVPLLALPVLCAAVDLGLQLSRFPRPRVPDAAIANGLFLTLILWPTTVSLELVAVAAATVAVRHLLRSSGHPWFNPAAVGVTVAATLFALPQPWHVGVTLSDTLLVAVLGLVLWTRARHTWRLWVAYFAANVAAAGLIAYDLGGHAAVPLALQAALLGPAPVFYGLFMVTEPRTAPSSRPAMLVFGAVVGVAAAGLPAAFALLPLLAPLGVLAPYLALFAGNAYAVAGRSHVGARPTAARAPAATRSG